MLGCFFGSNLNETYEDVKEEEQVLDNKSVVQNELDSYDVYEVYDIQEYESFSSEENYFISEKKETIKMFFLKHFTNHQDDCSKVLNELYLDNELECIVCVVCMSNKINVLFTPCNHLITCNECSKKIKKCCVCQEKIKGKMKVFTPFN
jgi:hypothetical protein